LVRVAIVGGGTGGVLSANLLAAKLSGMVKNREAAIKLFTDKVQHIFQPANLDIAFRGANPSRYIKPVQTLLRRGVELITEKVVKIDLADRKVVTENNHVTEYDYIVISTGSVADPSLVPGLAEGAYNFHTGPSDAMRIWNALERFDGGRVVVAIAGVPHKCPPAPTEAIFLLDDYLRRRGLRERSEIMFLTPYPHAYPAKPIAEVVEPLLAERNVEIMTFFNVESVDPVKKQVFSMEGEGISYDLLIVIPPHRGASVIFNSEIGDNDGWIPTDKHTMTVSGFDDAFAIGDATNIPISKSGVVAHLQAGVVAHNIASMITGEEILKKFNGRINCPLEVGGGKALFVSGTYTRPPAPQTPTRTKYLMKKGFTRLYWLMLKGYLEPLFNIYFREKNGVQS